MGRLSTPPPPADPATTVQGCHGVVYACPTLNAVDAHIAHLRRRIAQNPPRFPRLAEAYRADIDLLLDRRAYLMLVQAEDDEGEAA